MNLIDDATLLKMAEAEILKEAKQAAARHSIAGISGWQPCPKPNKMFLTNTILQTMASNKLRTRKLMGKGDKKPKSTERKFLQKKSRTDMTTNFIYQKPKKNKEKSLETVKSNQFNSSKSLSKDKHSRKSKEVKEKNNIKKVKYKKV